MISISGPIIYTQTDSKQNRNSVPFKLVLYHFRFTVVSTPFRPVKGSVPHRFGTHVGDRVGVVPSTRPQESLFEPNLPTSVVNVVGKVTDFKSVWMFKLISFTSDKEKEQELWNNLRQ